MNELISRFTEELRSVDPSLLAHSERVADLASLVAITMQRPKAEVELIFQSGFLHDIGKVDVPMFILEKAGSLTLIEQKIMQGHSRQTYQYLWEAGFIGAQMAASHHDREDVSLGTRIITVADFFEAVTADRCYHKGVSEDEAINLIRIDKTFDDQVVKALIVTTRDGVPQHRIVDV